MARLGSSERTEFQALRSLCYAGLDSIELRERIGQRLRDVLDLDAFCLMELEPTVLLPVHAVSHPWTAEAYQLLVERVILASPAADPARMHQSGRRTVRVEEMAADTRNDPYFAFHLLPYGYRYELATMCKVGGQPRALLNFTRAPRRGPFRARDIRLLDALAPHIAAGIHAAGLREVTLARSDAPTGVIILDVDGRLDFANAAAEEWLRQSRDGAGRWSLALQMAAVVGPASSGDSRVPVLETRNFETGVMHRLQTEQTIDGSGRPRTLILIEPIRSADRPSVLLQLGLTSREAEVAARLLQGYQDDQIAGLLGCAPETVRVHLRNIYEKLGVTSRRELAALLMGGRVPRP